MVRSIPHRPATLLTATDLGAQGAKTMSGGIPAANVTLECRADNPSDIPTTPETNWRQTK